ncbi:MCE family protein [Jongsikchunia kroppenstedtii]|uniref:MCE family protein n=1 Tax=Jongsikchunia kroppenstedtii TaxID=1121721 RepID=UPI000361859B|nr:MlaD family protein [Jongsikchunia kroppenstedtii]
MALNRQNLWGLKGKPKGQKGPTEGATKAQRIWFALIASVVVIGVILGTLAINSSGVGKRDYKLDFAQAGQVRSGDNVKVAGVDVGKVSALKLNSDSVTITVRVNNDVHITANGSASIKLMTLLGQRYVAIDLGNSPSKLPGSHMPVTQTQVPYDLQKTLDASGTLLTGTDAGQLSQGLQALNQQMAGVPDSIKQTLTGLGDLSNIINNRRDQITKLVNDTDSITTLVSNNQYQLAVIVGQGQLLTQKIATREQLVTKLLDGIAGVVNQAKLLGDQTNGQVAPLIANLNNIAGGLQENRQSLRDMLGVLPIISRNIANATGNGAYVDSTMPWGLFPDNWLCFAKVVDGCQ